MLTECSTKAALVTFTDFFPAAVVMPSLCDQEFSRGRLVMRPIADTECISHVSTKEQQ